ncbi:hypothetical protein D3C77_672080 [compost metagenome]
MADLELNNLACLFLRRRFYRHTLHHLLNHFTFFFNDALLEFLKCFSAILACLKFYTKAYSEICLEKRNNITINIFLLGKL